MDKIECFKICIMETDDLRIPFCMDNCKQFLNIPCVENMYSLNPTIINADPFLFVHKDKLYLFYEEKGLLTAGVLKMMCTSDLKNWSKPVEVLKEPFHLSFPWVFEENGRIYMVPETGADNSVRLYEAANEDLTSFKFVKKLITAPMDKTSLMGYGDNCIYKRDNHYYLFTQIQYDKPVNELELYIADKLEGPYKLHPMSPIQKNMKVGRNAGSLLELDEKLYRFSQDCTGRYGDNVNISQITELDEDTYSETIVQENILDTHQSYFKEGGHQFNAVKFEGRWIIATDAKEYHLMFFHKVVRRLYNMLHI